MKFKYYQLIFVLLYLILEIPSSFNSHLSFRKSKKIISDKDRSLFDLKSKFILKSDEDVQGSNNEQLNNSDNNPSCKTQHNQKQTEDSIQSKLEILRQGWLKISSQDLKDEQKYSKIPIKKSDGQVEYLKVNLTQVKEGIQSEQQYFRQNSQYKEGSSIPDDASFWFRISKTNLYYTSDDKDMNILGAIAVKNLVSIDQSVLGNNCFKISSEENDQWDLCANSATEAESWICSLNKSMGKSCEESPYHSENFSSNKSIILIPLSSSYCNIDFNYQSHGSDWQCQCKDGGKQSPIDIQLPCSQIPSNKTLNKSSVFKWKSVRLSQVQLIYEDNMLKVKCMNDCQNFSLGSLIDADLKEFQAKEIVFHTPSDHYLQGQQYPLEIQIVFESIEEQLKTHRAVMSFLVQKEAGVKNSFFQYWDLLQLPNSIQKESQFLEQEQYLSIEQLFLWTHHEDNYQGYFGYAYYEGSLTYPPCDENVRWFVVDNPISAGITTIEMIRDSIVNVPKIALSTYEHAADILKKNPNGNNRELQPLNQRMIQHFDLNHQKCFPDHKSDSKIKEEIGHFEKVQVDLQQYIYVPGDQPSGLQNSQFVSKDEALGKMLNEDLNNKN